MTEKEVLEKLEYFKNAIIRLKDEKSQLETSYQELKDKYASLEAEFGKAKSEIISLREPQYNDNNGNDNEGGSSDIAENDNEGWSTTSSVKDGDEVKSTRRKPVSLVNDQPMTEMKNYRFGTSSPAAALKFKTFINKVVAGEELPFKITPEAAALQVGVSSKTKDSFINFLMAYKKDGKNLVVKVKDTYFSNFDADTITDYLFQEVSK